MAQPVAKRQKLESDENVLPQSSGVRYVNTTAHGNSRNVYGNVINTYNIGRPQAPAKRGPPPDTQDPSRRIVDAIKSIQSRLAFEQMDDRLSAIVTAHSNTCQWIFEREEYRAWRNSDALSTNRGFLWVKGKPGAGKSTLMKSAQCYGEQEHDDIIISFFFNARGVELQKSTQGMYRSLLYQLLDKRMGQLAALSAREGHSHHFNLLADILAKSPQKGTRDITPSWPIEKMKDMLRNLVLAFSPAQVDRCVIALDVSADVEVRTTWRNSMLALAQTPLTCYVDALDECENDDARDMIDFLGTLREIAIEASVGFRVLLSSRHYPCITFNACQELILDGQDGHEADIAEYTRSKLRIGHGKLADEIHATVQARASGVFLWVILVIRILNGLYDRGQIRRLRQRLNAIPSGLHELFEEILQKDCRDGDELLFTFQWLLFCQRPLSLAEFYHAVTGTTESAGNGTENCEQDHVSEDDMARFLLDASKGLAEMTKSREPTVQFIHESVKDYLLDTGLAALNPNLETDVARQCHNQLQNSCLRYLEIAQDTILPLLQQADASGLPRSRGGSLTVKLGLKWEAWTTCPFLEYAVKSIFYHAESALAPDEFVAAFPYHLWRRLYNLTNPKEQLSKEASPLYMLVMMDARRLADIYIKARGIPRQPPKQSLPERHPSLLGLAVRDCDYRMVDMLLDHGIGANWPAKRRHTCLSLAVSRRATRMVQSLIDAGATADPDMNSLSGNRILGETLQSAGQEIMMKVLSSNVYTARWHEDFNFILRSIKDKGYLEVEQMLISKLEALVNEVESAGQASPVEAYHGSALLAACIHDLSGMIAPLVKHGVDLGVTFLGNTGLSHATNARNTRVVQLLLKLGANPNIPNHIGSYPVHDAATNGHVPTLRVLLESGADPSVADRDQAHPLHMVADRGSERAMRLLIEHGADVNALDMEQKRPLHVAAAQGHETAVRLLIDHGADVNAVSEQDNAFVVAEWPPCADSGDISWDTVENCALVAASRRGFPGIVDMLLEAGDPMPVEQLNNAAVGAFDGGHDGIVARLIRNGAKQPLHWALRDNTES